MIILNRDEEAVVRRVAVMATRQAFRWANFERVAEMLNLRRGTAREIYYGRLQTLPRHYQRIYDNAVPLVAECLRSGDQTAVATALDNVRSAVREARRAHIAIVSPRLLRSKERFLRGR
jgi:phosphoserine phosphatase